MFNYLKNNWMKWYYDTPGNWTRSSDEQTFVVEYDCPRDTTVTLRESAIAACKSIRDTYSTDKFCLMLSGGSESEICVRSFALAKIPFHVYIGRYENDINLYDVSYAVTLCESMGLPYTILDFKLQKFLEKDAFGYGQHAQINEARLLPQLALCDLVDGIPIMSGGEPVLSRIGNDYAVKGTWIVEECENFWGWPKHFVRHNRVGIADWCRWSPELYQSWINLPWFQKLINDEYYGKLGAYSTKLQGYRHQFPELLPRIKKTGFEKIDSVFDEVNKYLLLARPIERSYAYTVEGFFTHQVHSQR
jgi:hypothetical protein